MAILDLIVKQKQKIRIITINTLGDSRLFTPDNVLTLTHSFVSEITSNPIEGGANVTDNIITQNREISFQGIITERPLETQIDNLSITTNLLAGIKTNINLVNKGLINILQFSTNRMEDGYNILEDLFNKKTPFYLQTGFKLYENMVIKNLTITESPAVELRFNITLEQINIVDTEFVLIPKSKLAQDAEHTGSSKIQEGRKSLTSVSEEVDRKGSTILFKLTELIK